MDFYRGEGNTFFLYQILEHAIGNEHKLELSENLTLALLQCLTCSKRPECLWILSGNVILTSIKDPRTITILQTCEKGQLTIPT